MTQKPLLRVYLVDDEPLALKRLGRLLRQTGQVEIVGSTTDCMEAVNFLSRNPVDALFLDIQMPVMNGFELLAKLPKEPAIVFTTAFDQYALNAFQVNSIDYLLKPVEEQHLARALAKLDRMRGTGEALLEGEQLRKLARELSRKYPQRLASRLGERVVFVEVDKVTHFYAKDKLTYAAAGSKDFVIDLTISELELKLDPEQFLRIHRSTLVNLGFVEEVHSWFGGGLVVRLKDTKRTELQVARDRVRELKARMEF